MKKTNSTSLTKLTLFVLFITVIAVAVISGTFAKYVSEKTGSDTATVASWKILLDGDDITVDNTQISFDLFKAKEIYDLGKLASTSQIKDTDFAPANKEEDVTEGTDNAIIAPGTFGKVDLKVENKSQVTAKYTVTVKLPDNTETTTIPPIKISANGTDWYDVNDLRTGVNLAKVNTVEARTVAIGGTDTLSVYWKWDFENNNDAFDTKLGTTAANLVLNATINAEQVN